MAEKKFGNRVFKVGAVLATDSIKLQVRLLKVVGSGFDDLTTIMKGVGKEASEEAKAKSNAAIIGAMGNIFAKCQPDEITQLISDIVGMAMVQTASSEWKTVDLDADFTDSKKDLLPVCAFILKEVLGDFFSGALASGALKKVVGA